MGIIRRYVKARKAWHLAVTASFFLMEAVAIFTTHEIAVHLGLTSAITTWEMAVLALGE